MRRTAAVFVALAVLYAGEANAQFMPVGPQQNVSLSTILSGGWTQCYAATFATYIGDNAEHVLSACNGDYLMMAGRATGADVFLLAAAGALDQVTVNTGANSSNTHIVNGSQWYFAPNWSWGFAPIGETVNLGQCDTAAGAEHMCLHTINGAGGYRIGNTMGLNGSTAYEKVFFVANDPGTTVTPEPVSMALLGTGLAGLVGVARRRRNREDALTS